MEEAGASLTYSPTAPPSRTPDLRILHYNDVYHVDASSSEPVGGYARFQTLCDYYRNDARFKDQPELVTVFSGDVFNPSLESSVTKGSHMVSPLNKIGTDVACVGNHDLDFGVTQFRALAAQCKFPWLLANVIDPALGKDVPIGRCQATHIHTVPKNNVKIGFVGIGEREWLATINSLPPNLEYRSASATAKLHSKQLQDQGVDIVIAISHAREPNDVKLADQTGPEVLDIVLGGHDHFYNHMIVNDVHVVRSGTDFKQLSYIEGWKVNNGKKKWEFRITRRDIVSGIPEEPTAVALVEKLTKTLHGKLERPIGYTLTPLDSRFTTVRLKESNVGNFVCDLMKNFHEADCCIMAGGTIRGDQIYPPGVIKLKDIMNCFPFEDPVVVIKASGQAIWDALENGVSLYPALEGRFPQVSGMQFSFCPTRPPGSRVLSVNIKGQPLDRTHIYVLATRGYMARGKDGFTSLLMKSEGGETESVVDEENGILISTMIRQFFMSLKIIGKWRHFGPHIDQHWQGVRSKMGIHKKSNSMSNGSKSSVPAAPLNAALLAIQKSAPESIRTHPKLKQPILPPSGIVTPTGYDSDAEGYDSDLADSPTSPIRRKRFSAEILEAQNADRRAQIVRQVLRKWRRLAGVGDSGAVDPLGEGEFEVHWTSAVAPKLENRIIIVEE